jgi:CheY-like chemotaxis protein
LDAADSLALLLGWAGYETRTAGDGPRALASAQEFRPEAVLLDIGLPGGMNGYEVARRLRRESGLDGVYLVATTGYGAPDDVTKASEAGFDQHLVKPADPAEVKRLLAARRHNGETSR